MAEAVLAVFYYNSDLVTSRGDPIGLNLFEPRYQKMCQRMQESGDPRFLFMPNFQDYQCAAGDVGFIIRLTRIEQRVNGQFGIEGYAESLAAVECRWVDPGTQGLHYAKVASLNGDTHMTPEAVQELIRICIDRGWTYSDREMGHRIILRSGDEASELVLGINMHPLGKAFALTRALDHATFEQLICDAPPVRREALAASLHRLPAPPESRTLTEFLDALAGVLLVDGCGMVDSRIMERARWRDDVNFGKFSWLGFLREARVCGVKRMAAALPTARVELCLCREDVVEQCWLTRFQPEDLQRVDHTSVPRDIVRAAHVSNGSSVSFIVPLGMLRVTAASLVQAATRLSALLNRQRWAVIARARSLGHGPLATLGDETFGLIYSLVVGAVVPVASSLS